MAYTYAAFDGFKRLAAGGSLQTFGSEQKWDIVEFHQLNNDQPLDMASIQEAQVVPTELTALHGIAIIYCLC